MAYSAWFVEMGRKMQEKGGGGGMQHYRKFLPKQRLEAISQAHCKYQSLGSKKMRLRVGILLNAMRGVVSASLPSEDSPPSNPGWGGRENFTIRKCS